MKSRPVLEALVIAAGLAASIAACVSVAPAGSALADDLGCHTCHARKAPPLGSGPVPIAPAWEEIARRYRHDSAAELALAQVLVGGTEERHWKGEPLVTMLPHEKWVTPGEARELVRWIFQR